MPVRYFVLADDGQKYGPADVSTLNSWISDNRLLPHQMLEEEASGARIAASAVPGLNFPATVSAPTAGPAGAATGGPGYSGYYRGPDGAAGGGEDSSKDITIAWILFGVGIIGCCLSTYGGFLVPGAGVYFANRARQKGHPQGGLVFGLTIGLTVISVIIFILGMVGLALMKSGQFPMPGTAR
jgi:hypothetical protein